MGHTEAYQFIDPRDGEYGVCYSKPTLEQAELAAAEIGYSGAIQKIVIAYPPKPSPRQAKREEECEWLDIDGYPGILF